MHTVVCGVRGGWAEGEMVEISEIEVGGLYETERRQIRKVLRVTEKIVFYQIIERGRPPYRMTVSKGKFAFDAAKRCRANQQGVASRSQMQAAGTDGDNGHVMGQASAHDPARDAGRL